MKTIVNINGEKRYEDDDGNSIILEGARLEIAEATDAGGDISASEVMDILDKYKS